MKEYPPNLFRHATSELSQDAMLAWLLGWIDRDGDSEKENLRETALDLVDQWLLISELPALSEPERSSAHVTSIQRQKDHADLVVDITFRDRHPLHIVVEDKTHTTHHSDQLEHAANAAEAHARENRCTPLLIYFKTGWLSEHDQLHKHDEMREDRLKFNLAARESTLAVLRPRATSHPLLRDYVVWLERLEAQEKAARDDVWSRDRIINGFESPAGIEAFATVALPPKHFAAMPNYSAYTGNSRGRPWHIVEILASPFPTEKNHASQEVLFWRFDTQRKAAIASLRRYWPHTGSDDEKKTARERHGVFHEWVRSVIEAHPDLTAKALPVQRSRRPTAYREQELLVFTMGTREKDNEPHDVATIVARITRALLSESNAISAGIQSRNSPRQ